MSSKRKLLICGGTGFIGRNLCETFSQLSEYDVHATHFQREAPKIPGVTFHRCDLRQPEAVTQLLKGFDILIQAAATTSGAKDIVNSPSLHVTDNAVMNSYLFREAVSAKVQHVLFFSCSVMYPQLNRPVTETDFHQDGIYSRYFGVGWTKVYLEKMAEFFSSQQTTRFTVLRHSNIYGPYDKYDLEKSHVFGASVTKVMTAKDEVVVWGTGEEERDFLYVDDLMQVVRLAIEKQKTPYLLINAGSGTGLSVKDLVSRLIEASGRSLRVRYDSTKPSLPVKIILNSSLAKQTFGWEPRVSIEAGIERTLKWYKENLL